MTNEDKVDDDDDLSRKWRGRRGGARMWHRRWRRSIEAKTEGILVVGCFTSFMCKWIGVMIAVDQACPGYDVGLNIKGSDVWTALVAGDDEVLNTRGLYLWTRLVPLKTWV